MNEARHRSKLSKTGTGTEHEAIRWQNTGSIDPSSMCLQATYGALPPHPNRESYKAVAATSLATLTDGRFETAAAISNKSASVSGQPMHESVIETP